MKIGTVFEDSHVKMHLWLQAMFLLCSSKKGISSNQLARTLGVTLKTAWFMSHRIREAMRVTGVGPMGGEGSTVEVDETYIGRVQGVPKPRGGSSHKNVVLTLVERSGEARSFHVESVSIADMMPIVHANVAKETAMMTDQGASYPVICEPFSSRETVNHAKENMCAERRTPIQHKSIKDAFFSTKTFNEDVIIDGRHIHVVPTAIYCYTVGRNITAILTDSIPAFKSIKHTESEEAE